MEKWKVHFKINLSDDKVKDDYKTLRMDLPPELSGVDGNIKEDIQFILKKELFEILKHDYDNFSIDQIGILDLYTLEDGFREFTVEKLITDHAPEKGKVTKFIDQDKELAFVQVEGEKIEDIVINILYKCFSSNFKEKKLHYSVNIPENIHELITDKINVYVFTTPPLFRFVDEDLILAVEEMIHTGQDPSKYSEAKNIKAPYQFKDYVKDGVLIKKEDGSL